MTIMDDVNNAMGAIDEANKNTPVANPPAATVVADVQMPSFKDQDSFWFLGLTPPESFSIALGIKSIKFTPAAKPGKSPSAAQIEKGLIGRVTVRTYYATMNNVPIFALPAKEPVGDNRFYIYCKNPSYMLKDKRISDGILTKEAEAQILNYVFPMIDQTTPGNYPQLITGPRNLWWLQDEPEDIMVSDDILSYNFIPARSEKQKAAHIAGKAYFKTPAIEVNNCTVFSYRLDTPVDGHSYDIRIANPTYKDAKNEQRSDVFLTAEIKKRLSLYIDSRIES